MKLHALIRATLLSVVVPGCVDTGSSCPEDPDVEENFLLDVDISDEDWSRYQTAGPEGGPPETCEELCAAHYEAVHAGQWVQAFVVATCYADGDLPDASEDTADTGQPAAGSDTGQAGGVAGRLTCSGSATVSDICLGGRRPRGYRERPGRGPSAPARSLAAMADLEAASVLAFEELASWLKAQGAPDALIARCRAAAEDERRHARMIGALARRRGGLPTPLEQEELPADLLAVALHNAVEGCVHESWAALEATWQADHADPELRPAFARVAQDEIRHGELAWDLHRWLYGRLDSGGRSQVQAALLQALATLPDRLSEDGGGIGRPSGATGRALAIQFASGLRAAASLAMA